MKLKPCSVQEVPFGRKPSQTSSATAAVCIVPDNRMSNRREMHPDLMRPTSVQMRTQKVSAGEARKPAEIRACVLPRTDDCHTLSVSRVARSASEARIRVLAWW